MSDENNWNPLCCDQPGCHYVARSYRKLHKHYCEKHLAGIVRPGRIAQLRRQMKGEEQDAKE